jgi:hypothetical protein
LPTLGEDIEEDVPRDDYLSEMLWHRIAFWNSDAGQFLWGGRVALKKVKGREDEAKISLYAMVTFLFQG